VSIFLTAEWRDIAVVTYSIEASLLQPYLPPGLRIDRWQGQTLVSLVGFRFLKTQVLGVPVPFWGSFPEVNLRFYVCRDTPEGERRGVVFIKEIVPYYAVAKLARDMYNENYHNLPMSYDIKAGSTAEYRWRSEGRENRIAVVASGLPRLPDDDSLETFIVEHHWGYVRSRMNECIEYEVERRPWRTYPVSKFEVDVDAPRMYGDGFGSALGREPISVLLAEGSKVAVSFGRPVTPPA